jgi:hypothetical protein
MSNTLKNQLLHEHKAWQRELEFFKQENALLKYRLSEIVDENEASDILLMAEYFQNELLLKDEMIGRMTRALEELSEKFNKYDSSASLPAKMISRHQDCRSRVLQLESNFLKLSKDFNEKLLQCIRPAKT